MGAQKLITAFFGVSAGPLFAKRQIHRLVLGAPQAREQSVIPVHHLHVVSRTRPKRLAARPDEEITSQWMIVLPKRKNDDSSPYHSGYPQISLLPLTSGLLIGDLYVVQRV